MEIFAVCVITLEPIKIQTCSSPQNDRLNLSFAKDIKVIGKKPTRFGDKMDFCQLQRPNMSGKFDAPPSIRRKRQGRKFCLLQRSVNSTLRSLSIYFSSFPLKRFLSHCVFFHILEDWPFKENARLALSIGCCLLSFPKYWLSIFHGKVSTSFHGKRPC